MGRHTLVALVPTQLVGGGPFVDVALLEVEGFGRVAAVLPTVPEDVAPSVREGLARRRLVMTTGRCPCGAVMAMPDPHVEHLDGCPAIDVALLAALGAL